VSDDDNTMYFASTGAGSPRKPAIVDPRGNIIAVASSPEDATMIVAALNATTLSGATA
jgi:hypothetical protein